MNPRARRRLKATAILVLAWFVTASSLHARLWETEAELKDRFGDPVNAADKEENHILKRIYQYNGTSITVTFLNGKSAGEEYKGVNDKYAIDSLLQANAGKYYWKPDGFAVSDASGQAMTPNKWILCAPTKNVAYATYEGTTLTIATIELLDYLATQENGGALKGF